MRNKKLFVILLASITVGLLFIVTVSPIMAYVFYDAINLPVAKIVNPYRESEVIGKTVEEIEEIYGKPDTTYYRLGRGIGYAVLREDSNVLFFIRLEEDESGELHATSAEVIDENVWSSESGWRRPVSTDHGFPLFIFVAIGVLNLFLGICACYAAAIICFVKKKI